MSLQYFINMSHLKIFQYSLIADTCHIAMHPVGTTTGKVKVLQGSIMVVATEIRKGSDTRIIGVDHALIETVIGYQTTF